MHVCSCQWPDKHYRECYSANLVQQKLIASESTSILSDGLQAAPWYVAPQRRMNDPKHTARQTKSNAHRLKHSKLAK